MVVEHRRRVRSLAARWPGCRVPHRAATEGLAAVDEALVDVDDDRDLRYDAVDRALLADRKVGDDRRTSVDAQRLVETRDDEEQPHGGAGDDVAVRVDAVVARQVTERDTVLVERAHETGRAAARRGVDTVAITRREHEQR